MTHQVNFIALDIKKWVLEHKKINSMVYLVINNEERSVQFDSLILKPNDMLDNFMAKLRTEIASKVSTTNGSKEIQIEFENQTFLRQQLFNYFKKITNELRGGSSEKNHRGIRSTHLDVYTENDDITFLPEQTQFYIILSWCRNYYNREEYKKAIDPLRKLLKLNPQFGLGYKWLARSLKKIRKYDEAMANYQKYAEVDGSIDAYLDLAKSYRKGKIFDKSEEIYLDILKSKPENKEAQIGLAQIKYAIKDPHYLTILDELFQSDETWLKKWLIEEFNFRIYVNEKTLITPMQATKFLGFNKVFELTSRAFKNDLPSHFNPTRARLSFYKEELENWATVMNRFQCLENEIKLYPKNIEKEGFKHTSNLMNEKAPHENGYSKRSDKSSSSKVEEILNHIRKMKAQRAAFQAEKSFSNLKQEEKRKQTICKEKAKTSKTNPSGIPKKTAKKKILSRVEN